MPTVFCRKRLDEACLLERGKATVEGARSHFDAREALDVLDERIAVLWTFNQARQHQEAAIRRPTNSVACHGRGSPWSTGHSSFGISESVVLPRAACNANPRSACNLVENGRKCRRLADHAHVTDRKSTRLNSSHLGISYA